MTRPRDHLDDVFDRYSAPGVCEYCGDHVKVYNEPFGHKPACKPCFDVIVGGEESE